MNQQFQAIQPNQAIAWLLTRTIGFVFVLAICIGVYVGIGAGIIDNPDFPEEWLFIGHMVYPINAIATVLVAIYTFLMPFLQQRAWCWRVDDDRIECRFGVISKHVQLVPESRVQHITVRRSLMDRILGLAHLSVVTASSTITIPGLLPQQAEQLAEQLNDRVNVLTYSERAE